MDVTLAHPSLGNLEVLLGVNWHELLVERLEVGDVHEFAFLGVN